jgi:hypothetical protein
MYDYKWNNYYMKQGKKRRKSPRLKEERRGQVEPSLIILWN